MQIDLFKSRRRNQESAKRGGYVKSRNFELDPKTDFNKIRQMCSCTNTTVIDNYIQDIKDRIAAGRKYEDIGSGLGKDNLFDIEALGVGLYAKRYQIILSFEDKLDYLLHVISGCDMEKVRSIPHYLEVSSAFVALKQTEASNDATFSLLYNIDPKLDEYFLKTAKLLKEQNVYHDEQLIEKLAYDIEIPILREVAGIQNYIIAYMSSTMSGMSSMVCRSRDYASLIFSSDTPLQEDIVLTYEGHDNVVISPRCYEKYEYAAKEVLVCDSCRRCNIQ